MISRLEDLCGIQGAIVHANDLEVKETFSAYLFDSIDESWFETMEKKVSVTLQKFNLVLREKISIPMVVYSLLGSYKWAKFHEKFGLPFDYCYYFLRSSFFTSNGMVNKEKAAREILKDTEISSSIRFSIACYYCFSDVIPALWEQLPEDNKPKIVNGIICTYGLGNGVNEVMVFLWSRILLGKHKKGEAFLYCKFEKRFEYYMFLNDVSFKNCFEELNEVQRKEVGIFLKNKFLKLKHSVNNFFEIKQFLQFRPQIEIVKYLLHSLDENQLKVFFQEHGMLFSVLHHLLNWPYQHLFLVTVNRFWELLPKSGFYFLLYKIVTLMNHKLSRKFYDFRYIFKEFWIQSPSYMKTFFFRVEGGCISTDAEEYEEFKCYRRDFHYDFDCCIIADIFNDFFSFTIADEIIRLIFACATMKEKLCIVKLYGLDIGEIAIRFCDLKRLDLFVECCVPNERVRSFKRNLFNSDEVLKSLWDFIIDDRLLKSQKFLSWGLNGEEIKEYQQRLLHSFLTLADILSLMPDELKYVDKFLKWVFSSDEIKVFKESMVVSVDHLAVNCDFIPLKEEIQKIDFYLNWIDLSQKDCKDFKRQLAFHDIIIEFFSKCVSRRELCQTDEFIRWAELTESEIKKFKKRLVFIEQRNVSSACASLIVEGKSGFVEKLLRWTQFSKEEVKDFYFILLEDVTKRETKLVDIKNFFSEFPLSEDEEEEIYKKNFSLKTADVIEYYVVKNKWDEIEEVLNSRFSFKNEICEFKKKFPSEISWLYIKLISDMKFDDVDKLFNWTGTHGSLKKRLLKNIIFNSRIYEMVATLCMGSENEIERFLNWLSTNDLLLNKWKESFLNWFNETKVEGSCFYSYCESQIDNLFCSSCERYSPSSKNVSEFIRLVDEHVNKWKGKRKKKLESSLEINTRQTKRSRHC